MPALFLGLGTLIANTLAAVMGFFALYMTKRVASILAAVAMTIIVTLALWAALAALASGLSAAVPDTVSIAAGWILPNNIDECFAVYMSARLIRFAYDIKMRGIQMRLI